MLLDVEDRKLVGRLEAALRQWRTYRWIALGSALSCLWIGYRMIMALHSEAVAAGMESPANSIIVVPASWMMCQAGACVLAYVLVCWNGSRQQRIVLRLIKQLEAREDRKG